MKPCTHSDVVFIGTIPNPIRLVEIPVFLCSKCGEIVTYRGDDFVYHVTGSKFKRYIPRITASYI